MNNEQLTPSEMMDEKVKKLVKKNAIISTVASALITIFGIAVLIASIVLWVNIFKDLNGPKEDAGEAITMIFVYIILIPVALVGIIFGSIVTIVCTSSLIASLSLLKKNDDFALIKKKKKALTFINVIMYIAGIVTCGGSIILAFKAIYYLAFIVVGIAFLVVAVKQSKNLKEIKNYIY